MKAPLRRGFLCLGASAEVERVASVSDLGQPWQTIGDVLNWGTWLALVTEFVVMMIVVPNRGVWLRRNPIDPIVAS